MVHKKKQMILKQNPAGKRFNNFSSPAKNLSKTDLGSVIFGCKHSTFKECVFKQLFGLPSIHYAYVRNVRPGMPLFLFNYSDRKLHGIFEAQSEGQMNINQYAWTYDGDDVTQFPAQVKVRIRQQCQPLSEDQFKPVIFKNYYEPSLFWFELDKAQTQQMIAMFMKSTVSRSNWTQQSKTRMDTVKLPTSLGQQSIRSLEKGASSLYTSSEGQALDSHQQKELTSSLSTKSWCSLFKQPSKSKVIKEEDIAPSSILSDHESEKTNTTCPSKVYMDWESIYFPDGENMLHEDQRHESFASNGTLQLDSSEQSFDEDHLDVAETTIRYSNDYSAISDNDTKAILSENSSHQSIMESGLSNDNDDWADIEAEKEKVNIEADTPGSLSYGTVDFSSLTDDVILKMPLSDLRIVALRLLHANKRMKSSPLMHDQTNHSLKDDQVQSETETKVLKEDLRVHESSSFHPVGFADELNSILLVGGYDGSLFLPNLDAFIPSVDNIRPLKSMDILRAYATSVQLNNKLYVLGGGYGSKLWYDTVQSYSLDNDCWVDFPSLSNEKGNLAAIGLDNKIFAMGGGNTTDCFRDVQMLDLGFGKWITSTPMFEKRFGAAAAQVKGMFYVVGGYDGENYLSSVEGFDPREHSWTRLHRMNTRRGCHSVTVLNEKLYAIGGYDGKGMVSSVEVYDPRFGSWTMAEPMNVARGYFGAAIIGGSIYSIGGRTINEEILSSVECYSEGYGWQVSNAKSVGKRSAFSAVSVAM